MRGKTALKTWTGSSDGRCTEPMRKTRKLTFITTEILFRGWKQTFKMSMEIRGRRGRTGR